MLMSVLSKELFVILLLAILNAQMLIHTLLQCNVVIEVYLLRRFEEEFACVQVSQVRVQIVVIVPWQILIVLLKVQSPLRFLVALGSLILLY